MAKISNTTVYPQVKPTDTDLLIITDSSDSDETKTVSVGDLGKYYTYSTKDITITTQQLLNLFTNPVVLLEPGPTEIIQVTNAVAKYNHGGANLIWAANASIHYGSNSALFIPMIFNATTSWATVDTIQQPKVAACFWPAVGAKVYLSTTISNPTSPGTPTGTVQLSLTYRVIQY